MEEEKEVSLKFYLERVISDLEKRYEQRFLSQEKALETAVTSTEKAIQAAKQAQDEVNNKGNEFRASLDDYQKNMISKAEAHSEFRQIRELMDRSTKEINDIKLILSAGTGKDEAGNKAVLQRNWLIGIIVACILNFLGIAIGFIYFIFQK